MGAGTTLDPVVAGALACPACRSSTLTALHDELRCASCCASYLLVDGIPVMTPPASATLGELSAQKQRQAAFTDHEVDAEYEVRRPRGTPFIHACLLRSKLQRGIRGLEHIVSRGTALVICGGSGMEAEFLARAGARVVCTDISIEGARRARERARRYGVRMSSLVADAERLPFQDRSFDVVWVHDGLHHLEQPEVAMDEMARVARRAISINEPARAVLTALAVRVGLAEGTEESGNRVERLNGRHVAGILEANGLSATAIERYAMLYRHDAGAVYRLLSRRRVRRAALIACRKVEVIAGPVGNKLSVRAVRRPDRRTELG